MNWDDCRFILALARQGTLSGAARRLGVSHATVSRRLGEIEAVLGRPLFDRDRNGYRATTLGEAVLAQAQAMEAAALAIETLAQAGEELAGSVRLTTARAMASGYLAARLTDFAQAHPQIEIALLAESRLFSLAQREADIAVRLGRPADADLLGTHLADIGYGFYATPALRAALQAGAPLRLIGFDRDEPTAEGRWMSEHFAQVPLALRSNNQLSQVAAARSGLGTALLPHYLAGDLAPVDLGAVPPRREIWLMIRRDLAGVPRMRAVTSYLVGLYRRDRALFSGETAASPP